MNIQRRKILVETLSKLIGTPDVITLNIINIYNNKYYSIPIRYKDLSAMLIAEEAFKDVRVNKKHQIDYQLLIYLKMIQLELKNKPLYLVSGYRTKHTNILVKGKRKSYHLKGKAADIKVKGVHIRKLHNIICRVVGNNGGVGLYVKQGFIHIDVRGYKARWKG